MGQCPICGTFWEVGEVCSHIHMHEVMLALQFSYKRIKFEAIKKKLLEIIKTNNMHLKNALFEHLTGMLTRSWEKFDPEKVNRWIGFIQGVLWGEGILTIDECKEIVK